MRRIASCVCAPLIALATPACAGALDEAKQALDQAAPSHCELLMMQYQGRTLAPESPERRELSAKFYLRAAQIERDLAPDMQRFEAAKAKLAKGELDDLNRHSRALLEACSRKASETWHVQIPVPVSPDAPPVKVAPYTPATKEKAVQVEVVPGAMQKQGPATQ